MKILVTGDKGYLGSEFWHEAFSIVDELDHIDITKAKAMLDYDPKTPEYTQEQIRSGLGDSTT